MVKEACPLLNTQCGENRCAWYDKANDCCSIVTIAMGVSISARTAVDSKN